MTTLKKITVSRVLHYLFILLTFGGGLLLLLNLTAYFGIADGRPFIRGWVTTLTESQSSVALPHPDGSGDLKLYDFGQKKLVMLEFADMSGILQARYLGYLFFQNLAWIIVLYLLYQLMRIFRNLDRGLVFQSNNTQRIRRIAVAVLCFPVANFIASRILAGVVYEAEGHTIVTAVPAVHIESLLLGALVALVIFALVEIFRNGAQLQQEQDLTI